MKRICILLPHLQLIFVDSSLSEPLQPFHPSTYSRIHIRQLATLSLEVYIAQIGQFFRAPALRLFHKRHLIGLSLTVRTPRPLIHDMGNKYPHRTRQESFFTFCIVPHPRATQQTCFHSKSAFPYPHHTLVNTCHITRPIPTFFNPTSPTPFITTQAQANPHPKPKKSEPKTPSVNRARPISPPPSTAPHDSRNPNGTVELPYI